MVPLLSDWLQKHVSADRHLQHPDGWVFTNPEARNRGGQWSETCLRRTWAKACTAVGVKVGLYEGTKHSLGTALKSAGVDDRVIAQVFGYADIARWLWGTAGHHR